MYELLPLDVHHLIVRCAPSVPQAVTETHLLQFGAMLGEASSRTQLHQQEAGGPMGHPSSFYGSPDTDAFQGPWEAVIEEQQPGSLRYWAWRRPLRKGLFMFMTRTVFLSASPSELRHFMLDDVNRKQWDGSALDLRHISEGHGESGMMYARVSFPKPMAARTYVYARRVWPRPCDGGCYCLAKSSSHPAAPKVSGRGVLVQDYVSGCVIRRPAAELLPRRYSGPAAEVLLVYFEDSQVRPGLANLGIKKGLWPLVQRTERALRAYQRAPAGALASAASLVTVGAACGSDGELRDSSAAAEKVGNAEGAKGSRRGGLAGIAADAVRGLVGGLLLPASLLHRGWGVLCRWQGKVATLVPRVEWRLLQWLVVSCAAPAQRLMTAASSSSRGGGSMLGAGVEPSTSSSRGLSSWFVRNRVMSGKSGAVSDGCRRVVSESGGGLRSVPLHRVSSHPLVELQQQQMQQELWQVTAGHAVGVGSRSSGSSRGGMRLHATRLQQLQQEEGCWGAVAAAAMGPAAQFEKQQQQQGEELQLHRVPSHALSEDDIKGATMEEELLALIGDGGSQPLLDLCDEEGQEEDEEELGSSCATGPSAYLTPALLARLRSGDERLLGEDWPVAEYMAAAAVVGSQQQQGRRGGRSSISSSCNGWQVDGLVQEGAACCCNCCFGPVGVGVGYSNSRSSEAGGARAAGGGSCSYCGSSSMSSSRTSSRCGSHRGRGQGGSRRRRLVVRLIQAAGVRLVHHLLVGNEGGQGRG